MRHQPAFEVMVGTHHFKIFASGKVEGFSDLGPGVVVKNRIPLTADKIEDGGPAFPLNEDEKMYGMSLRDYFAAAALASVLSDHAHDWELTAWFGKHATGITKQQILSRRAYDIADAMLAARKKGGE